MSTIRSPEAYLQSSREILRLNSEAFHAGCRSCYRVLAVELRLLLCDRKREHDRWRTTALISQVLPQVEWDAVNCIHAADAVPAHLPVLTGQRLTLDAWLRQPIWADEQRHYSIQDLIKTICEKDGGAHVDPAGIPWTEEYSLQMGEITCLLAEYVLIKMEDSMAVPGEKYLRTLRWEDYL